MPATTYSQKNAIICGKPLGFKMPDYKQYKGKLFDARVLPRGIRGIWPFHKLPYGLRPKFVLRIRPKKDNLTLSPTWNIKKKTTDGVEDIDKGKIAIGDINRSINLGITEIYYPAQYFLVIDFGESRIIRITFDVPPVDTGLRELFKFVIYATVGAVLGAAITIGIQQLTG